MALFRRNRGSTSTAIVAAAYPIEATGEKATQAFLRHNEDWQSRAWDYYDQIGEVRQVARSMGDVFARVPWFVGVRPDPLGDVIPLEDDPDPELLAELGRFAYTPAEAETAQTILADLSSPIGGQSEIRRQIGVSLFVPGECYLVGTPEPSEPRPGPPGTPLVAEGETVCWDVRSTEELEIDYGTTRQDSRGQTVPTYRLRQPGQSTRGKELPVDTFVVRIWRPHPRIQAWADSPMRSAMLICRELLTLTQAIEGAARSRTAGRGLLVLPNSMRDGAGQRQQGDGQAARTDKVVADIIEAASLAIADPASAASQVPLVAFVNDDVYEKVTSGNALIQWDREVDRVAAEQRTELLTRFANAIDWPAELLTGKVGINHWGAWLLKDEAFQSNAEPYEVIACDAITNWYLRPMLAAEGVPNVERFVVWYDPTGVVSDPDESEKAFRAAEHFLISNARERRAMGFTEDDAPSEEELAQRIAIQAFLRNPNAAAPPSLNPQGPPPQVSPPQVAAVFALGDGFDGLTESLADLERSLFGDVLNRADVAMRRALERANARLKTIVQRKDKHVYQTIRHLSPGSLGIGPMLGQAQVERYAQGEDLMAGAFDDFLAWYRTRIRQAGLTVLDLCDEYGVTALVADAQETTTEQDEAADRSEALLLAALLAAAAALLLRPEPEEGPGELPFTILAPGVVRAALTVAGGGVPGTAPARGYTSGPLVLDLFGRAGIEFSSWRWYYGDRNLRKRPFEPHYALRGQVFTGDEDDDRLGNPGYAWPGVTYFSPGDHAHCLCQKEMVGARIVAPSLAASGGTP